MKKSYTGPVECTYTQGRIYYEANEASASGPHHLGGPHQNFNAVSKNYIRQIYIIININVK